MKKSVCFAYYADGKFLGWYGDNFGSLCKTPKIYSRSDEQLETITHNFFYKMKSINEISFEEAKKKVEGLQTLSLLIYSSEDMLKGKDVELRIVECPEYDGPNPDFDKEKAAQINAKYTEKMKAAGIFDIPAPSMERLNAIKKFELECPRPVHDSWIFADYVKVNEWAKNEPTEFIGIIKPQING